MTVAPLIPLDRLASGAAELGLELSAEQLGRFDAVASLLVETNRKLNLTRITASEEIVTGHFLDSLTCLAAARIGRASRLIDIGSGAGFPGIPIAIARPDLSITLLDSTRKKLDFARSACELIGLGNVGFVNARAEDAGRAPEHRERYDVALARALSEMKIVAELCLPFVRVGGMLIAQKSADARKEIDEARALIGRLAGRVRYVRRIGIPGTSIVRLLAVVEKRAATPPEFPRAYSRISKGKRITPGP